MKRRRAFTLTEILFVIIIISSLAATIFIFPSVEGENEKRKVRDEAQNLALWLDKSISWAARNRADFRLIVSDNDITNHKIRIEWLGADRKSEAYLCKNARLYYSNIGTELNFSGTWFSMTPAATFTVRSKKNADVRFYVKISGTGYISVSED